MTDYMEQDAERLTRTLESCAVDPMSNGYAEVSKRLLVAAACSLRTLLAHIQRGAVPEGWQLVPKEPTREMWEAALAHITRTQSSCPVCSDDEGDYNSGAFAAIGQCCAIYADMLAAAPDHFRDDTTESEKISEQSAFEDWLEKKAPSGDSESVQRQWERSSEFEDWLLDQERAAAAELRRLHALCVEQIKLIERVNYLSADTVRTNSNDTRDWLEDVAFISCITAVHLAKWKESK